MFFPILSLFFLPLACPFFFYKLPLPDAGELELMRQVGKTSMSFCSFMQGTYSYCSIWAMYIHPHPTLSHPLSHSSPSNPSPTPSSPPNPLTPIEFLIDAYGYIRVGGVEMLDWKESGMAIKLVAFHMAVFLASFFYFLYTLVRFIILFPLRLHFHAFS